MSSATVVNDFVSELLANSIGPVMSIALLTIGPWMYGWIADLVLNQQLKDHKELDQHFGREVRALAAYYADCAAVLSNFLVATATTIWALLF